MKTIISSIILLTLLSSTIHTQDSSPSDIETVFQSYFIDMLALNPELASQLGVSEEMGVTAASDCLTDESEQGVDREYEFHRRYRSILEKFDSAALAPSQQLSSEILKWYIKSTLEGEQFRYHAYAINPMFGVHNSLTTLMTEYHTIESIDDAEDYIARLAKYPDKFVQLTERVKKQTALGIVPPAHVIEKTADEMAEFIRVPATDNILYTAFRNRLNMIHEVGLFRKMDLLKQVQESIVKGVYPSYQLFIDLMRDLTKSASVDAGVWKLPDGKAYYEYCLRWHTSTDLKPDHVHQLRLKEVRRIQKEAKKILRSLGIPDQESYGLMIQGYWQMIDRENEEDFYYPLSSVSEKQVLQDYQRIIENAEKMLPAYFNDIPGTDVIVQPVPDFKASTMGAYYSPASLDGRRKGIFYVNVRRLPFKPDMKTLAFHEALPGHHFQIAIQQESAETRRFQNLFHFTAFVEGWALYAERLAYENGWFDDVHTQLSYLNSELFRAVRLVVDTGIHDKRWTREQAYDYMMQNLGWGSYNEIDRYIVWPGQACAYKIGELRILALREKTSKKISMKDFHHLVLAHGALPLDLMDKWILGCLEMELKMKVKIL